MAEIWVGKFGGRSLSSIVGVKKAQQIMLDDERRRLCVVSAPGARFDGDPKVTLMSKQLAKHNRVRSEESDHLMDDIAQRYDDIYPGSKEQVHARLLEDFIIELPEVWYYTRLVSAGERLQGFCFAEDSGFELVDPLEYLVGVGNPRNAHILPETYERLATLDVKTRAVMAGFQCISKDGKVMILDDGGSDKTGSIVARGVGASVYENFTDSAVLSASPKFVSDPLVIHTMTRKELRDLSYSGFNLFQQSALQPLEGTDVVLHIRGTNQYPEEGTLVVLDRVSDRDYPVQGIACREGFCSFSVDASGINDEIGVLVDLLMVFKDRKIPVEIDPSGIDDISVVVHQDYVNGNVDSIKREMSDLVYAYQTGMIHGEEFIPDPNIKKPEIEFGENLACLVVAGKGLKQHPSVYSEVISTLSGEGIPIYARSTGMKKRVFIYAIDAHKAEKAVNVLYERFIKKD